MKPTFFAKPAAFRAWLEKNHEKEHELLVGFYKKDSGKPSITWPESVVEALCFGWIDGVRRRIDDESYSIRFTPRKAKSTWSSVNLATMKKLIADGLVKPAGLAAFERRTENNSEIYAYEQRHTVELDSESERILRRNATAWKNFQGMPAWYRRNAIWRIMSAKRPETKSGRLATLIDYCAVNTTAPRLTGAPSKPGKSRGRAKRA